MTTHLNPAGGQPVSMAAQPLESAAASHCGRVRANNQDAFLERPDIGLWAVADGMGGLASGERASKAVVEALAGLEPGEALADRAEASLTRVNDDLRWEAAMSDGGRMMGSTVVVLLVDGPAFTCLWAGDSRIYRWRNGSLQQLTSDHTPIQGLLDAGLVPTDHASYKGLDHMVNRAVGTEVTFKLDRIDGVIQPGDAFLLCSDGLSKVIDEAAIATLMGSDIPARAVQHLIEAALLAGGPDNVTAVIVGEHGPVVPVEDTFEVERPVAVEAALRAPTDRSPGRRDPLLAQDPAAGPGRGRAPPAAGPAPRWRPGEKLAWLAVVLALLVGILGIGVQKTELLLQLAASDPGSVDAAPVLDDLSDIEARLTLVILAEGLFLAAVLLGLGARRLPSLSYVGAAVILVGAAAAIVGVSDLGDAAALTAHVRLPTLPLPLSHYINNSSLENH